MTSSGPAARAARRGGGRRRAARGDRGAGRPADAAGVRGLADLAAELGREDVERLAQRGLGDELERALGQRVDGVGALGGGEGGHHDDRHGLGLAVAQRPQHAEAVEAGHVEVERERVGPVLAAQHERLVAVGGGADDVKPCRESASASRRRIRRESSATTTRRAPGALVSGRAIGA